MTYRVNKKQGNNSQYNTHSENRKLNWGLFELDMPAVDISTATYEEIANTYAASVTENAARTDAYTFWGKYMEEDRRKTR